LDSSLITRVSLFISSPTAVTVLASSVSVTARSVRAIWWSGTTWRNVVRITSSLAPSCAARVTRTSSWKYTWSPLADTTPSLAVTVMAAFGEA